MDDDPLKGHSISYRITLGPQAGRKVFTLQTLSPVDMFTNYLKSERRDLSLLIDYAVCLSSVHHHSR
jgi:hypothetical protein